MNDKFIGKVFIGDEPIGTFRCLKFVTSDCLPFKDKNSDKIVGVLVGYSKSICLTGKMELKEINIKAFINIMQQKNILQKFMDRFTVGKYNATFK